MGKQVPDTLHEAKYDVFISYSHLDYLDENDKPREDSPVRRLMDFLRDNGIGYWIDNDGEYGRNHLPKSINTAIDESKMMVFVSSYNSNTVSTWTPGEISRAFDHHIPVLPFKIDDTLYGVNIDTRVCSALHYDYFSNSENALDSLLLAIVKEKEHYQEELKKKREELDRKKISEKEKEYSQRSNELKAIFNQIVQMHIDIGDSQKICPVCANLVPIEYSFCKCCGWTFMPPFEISGDNRKIHTVDMEQLALVKGLWNEVLSSRNSTVQNSEQVSRMKKEIEEHIVRISKLESDNSNLKDKVTSYRGKISQHGKTEKVLKEKISESEGKLEHSSQTSSAVNPRHDYVDLGLPSGTLWATCNVGASKPSDYGDYFAWGETESKKKSGGYCWKNLKYWTAGDPYKYVRFSKYMAETYYEKGDNRTMLEPSDDAAHVQWGGAWRMPTHEEWEELHENCDWKWTRQDGCNGYKVTSRKNGSSIFLPAAGWRNWESRDYGDVYGYYWSSSLYSDDSYDAFGCFFHFDDVSPSYWSYRCRGFSIRPVASSLQ